MDVIRISVPSSSISNHKSNETTSLRHDWTPSHYINKHFFKYSDFWEIHIKQKCENILFIISRKFREILLFISILFINVFKHAHIIRNVFIDSSGKCNVELYLL